MSPTHNVGTRCWIQNKQEGWVSATVRDRKVEGDKLILELECENGETVSVTAPADADKDENHPGLPPLRNPPLLDTTEDLTDLSYLNEPSVLHAIRVRYSQLNIYTYSGIVLIATNPFQKIDSLYTSDIIQAYSGKQKGQLEPHLFAIAEDAYACMIRENRNQTIVVSGESGAGKTVSAKYIMRYFATVEPPDQASSAASLRKEHQMTETETQILATNPIMESFGNAKTTRNDNSSRFGKYIEILFDKGLDIIGAQIKTYLLERSRLVFQAPTERNYHIFYQLLAGVSDDERTTLGLESVEQFNYLNQGGDHIIPGVDDAAEFQATKDALDTIGITKETQGELFTILAALLHIGNIQIGDRRDAHIPSDEPSLVKACELLGLDPSQFAKWVTKKQIVTRGEKIISNLNGKQAYVVRDSVSKFVYSILFDWLVWKINHGLATPEVQARAMSRIGVLDIYGFEHFKHNSFEQFCINYANEKLQQEFNRYVFKLEQDEYVKEQIPWTFIDFSDNQPCIDLIEAKLGILSLLDEESRLPSGSDESWVQKLYNNFDNDAHNSYFKKPRFGKTSFTVNHYAMEVEYESEGFIEKNRDTVPDEQLEVLKQTSNVLLKEILETAAEKAGMNGGSGENSGTSTPTPGRRAGGIAGNRKPTLGGIFKSSLIDLMSTIESTKVHYIRCIKPNETKTAWQFDGPMVLSQLRACGVLETIRISCEGFPTRWTFEEFVNRYYMLVSSENWNEDIRTIVTAILENSVSGQNKYQIGVTKIFFRAGMLAYLENRRTERLNECAILIQKNLRRFYYRKRYLEIRNEMIMIQSYIRGFLARKRAQSLRDLRAATKIQSFWRGTNQRKRYISTRKSIISLQAVTRGYLVRKDLRNIRYRDAALTIQKVWRGYNDRRHFLDYRKKVILAQCCVRRRAAKKELDTLKIEARSADHFKSVSYQLENKVVELTQLLDSVRNENKSLQIKVDRYDAEVMNIRENHRQLKESNSQLEEDALRANFHEKKSKELEEQVERLSLENNRLQGEIEEGSRRINDLETSLEQKQNEIVESKQMISAKEEQYLLLTGEMERLQDENSQLEARKMNGGVGEIPQHLPAGASLVSLSSGKRERTAKRRSLNQAILERGFLDETHGGAFDPRPASMAVVSKVARGSNQSHSSGSSLLSVDSEMERLLDNDVVLYPEIMRGVIENMKIPLATREMIPANQVFVPAHIINLVIKEMWRLGMVKESERFLAMVLQKIQDQVLRYEDNEEINTQGPFWLSNVHEIYSFACLAEANISHSDISDELSEVEYKEYARLVSVVKHDLLNLEFNIYHTLMKSIKKKINSMIIPAVIESQSLPGFMTNEGSRFFKMLTSTPQYNMDDLLKYLSQVHFYMTSYYVESITVESSIVELFQLIGVVGFNDLLMRRNFLSWKRGLQISYNLTRMEEWCQTNGVPEGLLGLESLMQCAKLLQLKKDTIEDIDVIFDICWKLTPAQIQKIVNQYHVADYEEPIDGEFLKKISLKAQQSKGDKLLLESTPLDDSGPFDAAEPREITHLDTYVPAWLQTPSIKRLAELASGGQQFNYGV